MEKLKEIGTFRIEKPHNYLYRCLYLFRDSITDLYIPTKPYLFGDYDDIENNEEDGETEETMENLYNYLEEFKRLENLLLGKGIIKSIFDCEELFKHCSVTLKLLNLELKNSPNTTTSLSPANVKAMFNYKTCPDLKTLILDNYTPQNALLEFTYIKHKFVNLKELQILFQYGKLWKPLSKTVVSTIISYVVSVPRFVFRVAYHISMDTVKPFFDNYKKIAGSNQNLIKAFNSRLAYFKFQFI